MNSAKWIDLATLNQVTEIMNQAVDTATNVYGPDAPELRRLRKSKMGVDHVWLSRYYPLRCEARQRSCRSSVRKIRSRLRRSSSNCANASRPKPR